MEHAKVIDRLNSIGKQAFVNHFKTFCDYAKDRLSKDAAIECLVTAKLSNEAGAKIRLNNAKPIFQSNHQAEALQIVIDSNRMPSAVVERAKVLLEKCI